MVKTTQTGSRQQLVETFRECQELCESLFDANPRPVWIVDRETHAFLAVNDAAVAHYGYTRQEFLALTILDIRPPEDVPRLIECLRELGLKHQKGGLWRHLTKNGLLLDVEIMSCPVTFTGRPARLVVVTDVTERNRLAEQYRQAQRMEAIGQLAGGVAHDFNNLLTIISGYADIMLNATAATDPEHVYLEEIQKAATRAALLTRQLLAFSRKQVLAPAVLNLHDLIGDMVALFRRFLRENIEIVSLLEPALWRVKVDPTQIEQVLMNLAINAGDAMPQGGTLTLATANVSLDAAYCCREPEVSPGRYVRLSVTDTGSGMDEATRSRLFEPFFTTKEIGKGTGMGLATVYGILKQSGGHIDVSTEVGRGSTFNVYLPAHDGSGAQVNRSDANKTAATETILLVEDDPSVRFLVREVLAQHGYNIVEAPGGAEAVLLSHNLPGPLHLVLSDVAMPGMSGRELRDRLAERWPNLRFLYMSGYTDDALVHEGIEKQQAAFLQKPFTPRHLYEKVREVLDQ